jgi:transaldolase
MGIGRTVMAHHAEDRIPSVDGLRVKLFADGADLKVIADMAANPGIKGFTTNPTLMRRAAVADYAAFAREALTLVPDRPVSLEVLSDDFAEMALQALEIASWGPNVFVKIPVTNTRGEFAGPLIEQLAGAGVQLNVTAILTVDQVEQVARCLSPDVASYVSVFAGRIADTGRDPVPVVRRSVELVTPLRKTAIIWASPRELLNVIQADECGCHVITVTNEVLAKLSLVGRDLTEISLATVQMFRRDALAAGYAISLSSSVDRTIPSQPAWRSL